MTDTPDLLRHLTITADADLITLWTGLMGDGGFGRRTLWLVILDDHGRPAPVVVPIDDLPTAPSGRDARAFGTLLAGLADQGTPILLLSRPGSSAVQDGDRRWAAALAPLAPAWPVHLATAHPDGGSRPCWVRPILPPPQRPSS